MENNLDQLMNDVVQANKIILEEIKKLKFDYPNFEFEIEPTSVVSPLSQGQKIYTKVLTVKLK